MSAAEGNADKKKSAVDQGAEHLSGAEHFLVGVSPQYWAHTPLTIRSLYHLGLVDGIDCLVVHQQPINSRESTALNRSESMKRKRPAGADEQIASSSPIGAGVDSDVHFLPVSKCELQGVIVNADQKSNGSLLYLIDDGTGIVDCIQWVDNAMYALPSLLPQDDRESTGTFRVGDIVRILGKLKCVSIGGLRASIQVQGREWKVQHCVREVHITSISSVPLNSQSDHWLRCIQFNRRASINSGEEASSAGASSRIGRSEDSNYTELCQAMKEKVRNGPDVLHLLGPDIASKARERADFPAADDAYGAWRVFGAGCGCDLPYLDALLYCHCQATVVPLDPHFIFRDAVLDVLLQMENTLSTSTVNGQPMEASQLRFQYKAIVGNDTLREVATKAAMDQSNEAVSEDLLFLQTFAALRKDGIVALLDEETDTYLFISRKRVLEPHCKKLLQKSDALSLERRVLQAEQPAYLRHVATSRLQYIKKMLTDNQ